MATVTPKHFYTNGNIAQYTDIGKVDDVNLYAKGNIYSYLYYAEIVEYTPLSIITGSPILGKPIATREIAPVDVKRLVVLNKENRVVLVEEESRSIKVKAENRRITVD